MTVARRSDRLLLLKEAQVAANNAAPGRLRRLLSDYVGELRPGRRADALLLISEAAAARVNAKSGSRIRARLWRTSVGFEVEIRGGAPAEPDPLRVALLDRLAVSWQADPRGLRFAIEGGPPLTDTSLSESELFALAGRGDAAARDRLFERYLGFARTIAARFRRSGMEQEDLEQVAAMGLIKALDRFDPGLGVKFTTFGARTIEGELKRHLRDRGWWLRVPRRLQELVLEVWRSEETLAQKLGREPALTELADDLDVTVDEVAEATAVGGAYERVPLEAPPGSEEPGLEDRIASLDPQLVLSPEWADVSQALRGLPLRQREMLYLRFFQGWSQSEIAARAGISQMHVSRLLAGALQELRNRLETD